MGGVRRRMCVVSVGGECEEESVCVVSVGGVRRSVCVCGDMFVCMQRYRKRAGVGGECGR